MGRIDPASPQRIRLAIESVEDFRVVTAHLATNGW
jgi:hypothetical protein